MFPKTFKSALLGYILATTTGTLVYAQTVERPYSVIKPRQRQISQEITSTKQPSWWSNILVIIVNPIVPATITITDDKGRETITEADIVNGQADLELKYGKSYSVKVEYPGFVGQQVKYEMPKKEAGMLRFDLQAQYAKFNFQAIPANTDLYLDGTPLLLNRNGEAATVNNINPGNHTLVIRHPDYLDVRLPLNNIEAGEEIRFTSLSQLMERAVKFYVTGPPGAEIFIDNSFKGKINSDGKALVEYKLNKPEIHTFSVNAPGYTTYSLKEVFQSGSRSINVSLDPVLTATGYTEDFNNLNQWKYPSSWAVVIKMAGGGLNNKLEVKGDGIGTLIGKLYRDFDLNFKLQLTDGAGASWMVRTDTDEKNYYLFHLTGSQSKDKTPHRLYFYKVENGKLREIEAPKRLNFDLNQRDTYNIQLSTGGNKFFVTVTNLNSVSSTRIICTDTEPIDSLFRFGTIGFQSIAGEGFVVDDLTIEPKAEQNKITNVSNK